MKSFIFSLLVTVFVGGAFAQQTTTLVDKDMPSDSKAMLIFKIGVETGKLANSCGVHGVKVVATSIGDAVGLKIENSQLTTKQSAIGVLVDISKIFIEDMTGYSGLRKLFLHDDSAREVQEENIRNLEKSVEPTKALLTNENNDCRNSYLTLVGLFKKSLNATK